MTTEPSTRASAPMTAPGPTAAPPPGGEKKAKKPSEKEPEDTPILGLSIPVLIILVTVVVLVGAGFTWVVRRPKRVR